MQSSQSAVKQCSHPNEDREAGSVCASAYLRCVCVRLYLLVWRHWNESQRNQTGRARTQRVYVTFTQIPRVFHRKFSNQKTLYRCYANLQAKNQINLLLNCHSSAVEFNFSSPIKDYKFNYCERLQWRIVWVAPFCVKGLTKQKCKTKIKNA